MYHPLHVYLCEDFFNYSFSLHVQCSGHQFQWNYVNSYYLNIRWNYQIEVNDFHQVKNRKRFIILFDLLCYVLDKKCECDTQFFGKPFYLYKDKNKMHQCIPVRCIMCKWVEFYICKYYNRFLGHLPKNLRNKIL